MIFFWLNNREDVVQEKRLYHWKDTEKYMKNGNPDWTPCKERQQSQCLPSPMGPPKSELMEFDNCIIKAVTIVVFFLCVTHQTPSKYFVFLLHIPSRLELGNNSALNATPNASKYYLVLYLCIKFVTLLNFA